MPACLVPGCKSRSRRRTSPNHHSNHKTVFDKVTFYGVPMGMKAKWAEVIKIPEAKFTDSSTVCSLHFTHQDFTVKIQRKYLRRDAVPSIFNLAPPYLGDHTYQYPTHDELKERIDLASAKVSVLTKKLSNNFQALSRANRKCRALKEELTSGGGQRKFRADSTFEVVDRRKGPPSFKALNINKKLTKKKAMSDNEPKSFSIALKFNSLKSYMYVRNTFNFNLPNENVIKKWFDQEERNDDESAENVSRSDQTENGSKTIAKGSKIKRPASTRFENSMVTTKTTRNHTEDQNHLQGPSTSRPRPIFGDRSSETQNSGSNVAKKRSHNPEKSDAACPTKRILTVVENGSENGSEDTYKNEIIDLDEEEIDGAIENILAITKDMT